MNSESNLFVFRVSSKQGDESYKVVVEVAHGYVVEVNCTCDEAGETTVDSLYAAADLRQEFCRHCGAAVTHLHQVRGKKFGYRVEEL